MIRALLLTSVLLPTFALAQSAPPSAETAKAQLEKSPRHGEWLDLPIPNSAAKLHTFIVYPERKDKAPVVIIIHEIFGMSEWIRSVADALAAEGYIALAPDLLSGHGPGAGNTESFNTIEDVRATVSKLDKDEVMSRLNLVRDHALTLPAANDKSASIGFCWGGGMSFNYATRQPKLNAAIVYYGAAPKDDDSLHQINCPVLGLYAENDARIGATLEATTKSMKALNKSYAPHTFPGAGHGFLRQQTNTANKDAAQKAWTETLAFLKKNLQ